jgi:hypothetical protein
VTPIFSVDLETRVGIHFAAKADVVNVAVVCDARIKRGKLLHVISVMRLAGSWPSHHEIWLHGECPHATMERITDPIPVVRGAELLQRPRHSASLVWAGNSGLV